MMKERDSKETMYKFLKDKYFSLEYLKYTVENGSDEEILIAAKDIAKAQE